MTPTIEHFHEWAKRIVLDTGESWEVEDWQLAIVDDILSGKKANWAVVPEGNGKTTLMSGIALYHLDDKGWGLEQPFVVVAAATREQAEWLYLQGEGMVYATPGFKERFRCLPGHRRINRGLGKTQHNPRMQVFAADDRTADGAIFTLGIIDELHNHRDLRLYRRWRGKLHKRNGQLVAISTAGEPGSEFEDARSTILRNGKLTKNGAHIRAEEDELILNDWAVRDRSQADDMDAVAEANPASWVTPEILKQKRDDSTMTPEHWLRFTCDIPTRIEGSGILPEDWERCYEPNLVADPSARAIGGIDLGFSHDTTGLTVVVWEDHDRRIVAWTRVLEPPVDQSDIVHALCEAQEAFQPEAWVYDPNLSGAQMAVLLDKGTHPDQGETQFSFIEHSQSNMPMALAASRLDEAVRNGWLRHDGDTILKKHVLNAIKKDMGGGKWRYDRPAQWVGRSLAGAGTKHPIDALTALAMCHSIAVETFNAPAAEPLIAFG